MAFTGHHRRIQVIPTASPGAFFLFQGGRQRPREFTFERFGCPFVNEIQGLAAFRLPDFAQVKFYFADIQIIAKMTYKSAQYLVMQGTFSNKQAETGDYEP